MKSAILITYDKEDVINEAKGLCDAAGFQLTYRQHDGFDHSYFFIASFIEDHLRFHAKFLHA